MGTIGERVKEIRKDKELTMEAFGSKLRITRAAVSNIEKGNSKPSEQVILSICREFNINEDWLRTGEGDPHPPVTREAEIAEITATLFRDQEESFRYRLIKALSAMDENGWKYLEQIAEEVVNIKKD